MKKLMKYMYFLCVLCIFAISAPLLFADTMKPDILDVQTTFKIAGVDKTNVLVGQASGTVFVHGVASVTGSSTFNPANIGTLSAVFVGLDTIVDDARSAIGTSSGQNIIASVYGIGAGTATAISTTATRVHYIAIGTP